MTTTTYSFPHMLSGNPQRPFQQVTRERGIFSLDMEEGLTIAQRMVNRGGVNAQYGKFFDFHAANNAVCSYLRTFFYTEDQRDQNVPVVLGGGVVRDVLLGGIVNDVDIWLPSNIQMQDVQSAISSLQNRFNTPVDLIFNLNADSDANSENYRDVSNHWVLEFTLRGIKFNIMRTMVPWEAPEQFFTGVMRNFDIDLCMMFVGWLPGRVEWRNAVIIPQHMRNDLAEGHHYDTVTWNRWRLNATSQTRIDSRNAKMRARYNLQHQFTGRIPREDIVATPVSIAFLIEHMEQFPLPIIPVSETIEVDPEEDVNAPPLAQPTQYGSPRNAQFLAQPDIVQTHQMSREQIEAIMAQATLRMTGTATPWS